MMGRLEAQENLFYRFRIEDHVPKDHLLRKIDWLLDFDVIRADLADLYSHTGRLLFLEGQQFEGSTVHTGGGHPFCDSSP